MDGKAKGIRIQTGPQVGVKTVVGAGNSEVIRREFEGNSDPKRGIQLFGQSAGYSIYYTGG